VRDVYITSRTKNYKTYLSGNVLGIQHSDAGRVDLQQSLVDTVAHTVLLEVS